MDRRLPPPVTEIWDWQLRGACRGLDGGVFFHPDRERGQARAAREEQAKQVCRTCPVIQQCRRHALSVREPYGVWGGLSTSERDAVLDGGHRPPLRVAPTGFAARSGEPSPTPGLARNDRAGSGTSQRAAGNLRHLGTPQLAAPGRTVDLQLLPQPGALPTVVRSPGAALAPGTRARATVPAALTLIYGSREEPQQYLTVAEVAVMLRVSRATIYRLVHAGRLPGMRIGRSVRISADAVQRYQRDVALGDLQT